MDMRLKAIIILVTYILIPSLAYSIPFTYEMGMLDPFNYIPNIIKVKIDPDSYNQYKEQRRQRLIRKFDLQDKEEARIYGETRVIYAYTNPVMIWYKGDKVVAELNPIWFPELFPNFSKG